MRRVAIALISLVAAVTAQQDIDPRKLKSYEERSTKVLWKAGQRHVELGMWARKLGLNAQATEQFLLVREVSDGINTGGDFLLGLQRQYGEKFWRRHLKRVPGRLLRQYEKRARDLDKKHRKDRYHLASLARKLGLEQIAAAGFEKLLRASTGEIVFDAEGRIELDVGTIPADYAERFKDETTLVDGKPQVRDEFLAALRDVDELFVADSDALRVRSQLSKEHAERLHVMLSALLPKLEEAVGGVPARKLEVFVFKRHEAFLEFLEGAGYGTTHAHGLMDPRTGTALVSAEKRAPAVVQAIALHELTHLYDFAVSRAVFPSWYTEAFAETYGGIGTFAWADGELRTGGRMQAYRIEPLLAEGGLMPLRDMLVMDSEKLLMTDPEVAGRFYAQAWAFLRYLRNDAGEDVAEDLAVWEARVRGGAVGAEAGKRPRVRSQAEAARLFEEAFGARLDALDTSFRTWLESLAK